MAAEGDASVRLNLAAAGFLTALQTLEKESKELGKAVEGIGGAAQQANQKTSALTGSLKSGFGAAKNSLSELGSTLKSTLAQAATLGGALSLGAGVKGASDLISTYKDIAFAIRSGTGEAYDWTQVQSAVESTASKWRQSNEKLAESFRAIYADVGDAKFAAAAIDEVAKGATAGAGKIEELTSVAGALNEKFGITATELPDAMAAITAMGNKGGLTMTDFSSALGMVGSAAKAIGVQGPEGLKRVIGMMNIAEGSTKSLKGAVAGVSSLMADMADPDKIKNIQKLTGLKLTDKKGHIRDDVMEQVIVKTKGSHEALAKLFSGESLKIMSGFGEIFAKTFETTKGNEKKRSTAALDAFDAAIEAASEQTLSATDLQKQATERLDDPARRLDEAMNRFKKAFEKKEVTDAIDKLSESLPKLAGLLGDAVGFAAAHPAGVAAAYVGTKVGGAGAAGMAGDLLGTLAKKGAKDIGAEIAAAAAKNGAWSAAGSTLAKVAGPALAAFVAYEIGKAAIDNLEKEDAQNQNDLASARAEAGAAAASGDKGRMAKAQERLEGAISKANEGEEGVSGFAKTTLRGAASLFGDTPVDVQADAIARAQAELGALKERREGGGDAGTGALAKGLQKGGAAADKLADSHAKAAAAAERLARSLNQAGNAGAGGPSTNGLPPTPGNGSGSGAS